MSKKDLHTNNDRGPDEGAYERVMMRLQKSLADAEVRSWDYLQEKIEEAVELELTAEEMTRDEMDLLAAYIKRDMKQLGGYAHETGQGIAAWLNFDLNILEQRFRDLLMELADKTRIQQEDLRERLEHGEDEYIAGELSGPGTLACLNCGETQVLTKSGRIHSCAACQARFFRRMSKPWQAEDEDA